MAKKEIVVKGADPCPNGHGGLLAVPAPTDAMRRAAANKDANSWIPIPGTHDTADADFVAEHGDLFRCPICRYETRVVPETAAAGDGKA